jgi:competence protein ComEC
VDWVLLFPAAIFGAVSLWYKHVFLIPMVIMAGVLIGWWRGSLYQQGVLVTQSFIGQKVTIKGTVSDDVSKNTSGVYQVPLGNIEINRRPMTGGVQIGLSESSLKRGDYIEVSGVVAKGFGSYPITLYQGYLKSLQSGHDPAIAVRDWFVAAVRKVIKEPEASLGVGYLVGQKSQLPTDLVTALQIAGLTHVVVASGYKYNLTILVRLSRRLLMRFSKFVAMFGSVVLVVCMIGVTGLSPSMTRAGLVTGLSLATWYYGRAFHPMILLSLAAGVTALLQPTYVWHDLGWALSFTAFAGVMILGPLLHRYFFGEKEPGTIRQILGETVAAHLATAPLIVMAFGQISNVAIFTNMLVLPFVPIAMLLTFIAGVGSLCGIPFVGLPAQWLLSYMVWVTEYSAGLPWAQTIVQAVWWVIVIVYVILVLLILYMWRATRFDFRGRSIVA